MATREKKTPVSNKKQSLIAKDMPCDTTQENDKKTPKTTKVPIGKKLAAKKVVKKPGLAIKLKAKAKQNAPIKKITKTILKNAKTLDAKKKLLNNGVTEVKKQPRSRKKKDDATETTEPKKKSGKKVVKPVDVKIENEELSNASDVTDTSNVEIARPGSRNRIKKIKVEPEPVEDISFLIKPEYIKPDPDASSETGKTDPVKPKRLTKKQKLELAQKCIKKEVLDSSAQEVIDRLDLNVKKAKAKAPIQRRRHSIEKFPVGSIENLDQTISIFSQLPRSISPRSKRNAKVRQSIDGLRRSSPYTRSDSPARMLRNGKQRKLKDLNLLEGLSQKKRRRLCSDLSGSEMSVSKMSGYESDSSFSDLASLHGAETGEMDLKADGVESDDKAIIPASKIKRSLSTDTAISGPIDNLTDTNSNIYNDSNSLDINLNDKKIKAEEKSEEELIKSIAVTPSVKVPEKSFLLDIMKQTFNSDSEKKEETVVDPSTNFESTPENVESVEMSEELNNKSEETTEETEQMDLDNGALTDENIKRIKLIPPQEVSQLSIADETEIESKEVSEAIEEDTDDPKITMDHEQSEENLEEAVNIEQSEFMNEEEETEAINEKQDEDSTEKLEELQEPMDETVDQDEQTEQSLAGVYEDEELNQLSTELTQIIESQPEADDNEAETEEQQESSEEVPEDADKMDVEDDAPPVLEAVNNLENNKIEVHEEESEADEPESSHVDDPMPVLESSVPEEPDNDKENDAGKSPNNEESAEDKALKENILQALGLQSLQAAEEAKQNQKGKEKGQKNDNYTGTLKTVIKINRDKGEKKKGRNSLKMTLQKSKVKAGDSESGGTEEGYKIMKESASTSWKHGTNSSDTAGAHRHKSHYSNRSNLDGSSEHTSDGEANSQEGTAKALVIPEKASSFSIHPGRLCKDECSYCFGKFGLFDTPCHIAQMKNVDRQDRILATEKHLTRDSCLCDACYRHVDRKSNTPSYTNKSMKRNSLVAPGPRQNHCHVLGCEKVSTNILRRKWIIKMRKSICQVINIDLDNPGLHSIPICDEHYSALEHLMVCGMCKRRLARNHIHYLGPETADLNKALKEEGVPLTLSDKPVVCKLCKCFAAMILKKPDERPENSMNFFNEYKKRLLHFNDIVPMDEAAAEEPIIVPTKQEKEAPKKKKKSSKSDATEEWCQEQPDQNRVPSTSPSRAESPADFNSVDYNTLIPAIAMDCDSDSDTKKDQYTKEVVIKKIPRLESVKEAVEISKNLKVKSVKDSDVAVTKLGSNPSISVRQLFPGEEDLPLNAHIDFHSVKEKTPEGWEKCSSVIQYDTETKQLWNELQKPYGNQSSFIRHLILLEKYFRNGELVLSSNASHRAINYSESVQNRLRAFDNMPSNANVQPFSMMQFNRAHKSQSGIITSRKEPVTLTAIQSKSTITSQLNSPPLIPPNTYLQNAVKPKTSAAPPGLISLNSGGNARPNAPQMKVQQSQKIKFPITKNWRPNLIPIDPNKKQERKQGLVQVISGGKPYHITFEDYKKMCAIKRTFEMREKKRLQEAQNSKPIMVTHNSVLKSIVPRKGLIISRTTGVIKTEPVDPAESETPLEKLDKHVGNIGVVGKLAEQMPKIPKSLTVIPTVAKKPSRPSSPVLIITPKTSNKS